MSGFFGDWKDLLLQVRERILKPYSRPTAFFYLLVMVAALGGIGMWLTQVLVTFGHAGTSDLALGVASYAVAIVFTSIGDLLLDRSATISIRFFLFSVALAALGICGVLIYTTIVTAPARVGWTPLLLAASPVWVTWWIINGVDQRFIREPVPKSAIGGDPGQAL